MRRSIWHCTLVVLTAVSLTSISTGCRSGGWGMPSSSWVSWGKKKPPTSSIAGTREPTQPPSISVPPYPPSDPSSSSASSTAMASYPSSSRGSAPSAYGSPAPAANMPDSAGQPLAGPTGYATGPYNTASGDAASTPAQQGFYRPSAPLGGGPAASTADARGSYTPPATAPYGAEPPANGYPSPASYGAAAYAGNPAPTGGNYAPVTTPNPSYGAPEFGAADAGYPAPDSTGGYPAAAPTTAYPSTPYSGGYPSAGSGAGPSADTAGGYGPPPASPADLWRATVSGRPVKLRRLTTGLWSRHAIRSVWREPTGGAHVRNR